MLFQILKDVIKTSLKLAQAKNYLSLACIALGTGYLNYPRSVAARCMYTAVDEYVQANPTTCIQQIKFVMHAKDRETIEVRYIQFLAHYAYISFCDYISYLGLF